ncbi:hypothetical protein L3Y34_013802 [Caenorhabditis briggsae]|uniref:Uncharacterized protein n=1 Tax=Caenorhabditis briggsae TaxID=6238 RepID=A0AAE8ZUV7_CAEBR|nr:hypothetical protein L3Y34_013802 [Caenorhabditis briggsae]
MIDEAPCDNEKLVNIEANVTDLEFSVADWYKESDCESKSSLEVQASYDCLEMKRTLVVALANKQCWYQGLLG